MATNESTLSTIRTHKATEVATAVFRGAGTIALAGSFLTVYALFIVVFHEVFANAGAPIDEMERGVRRAFNTALNVPPAALMGVAAAYTMNEVNKLFDESVRYSLGRGAVLGAGVWFLPSSIHAVAVLVGVL